MTATQAACSARGHGLPRVRRSAGVHARVMSPLVAPWKGHVTSAWGFSSYAHLQVKTAEDFRVSGPAGTGSLRVIRGERGPLPSPCLTSGLETTSRLLRPFCSEASAAPGGNVPVGLGTGVTSFPPTFLSSRYFPCPSQRLASGLRRTVLQNPFDTIMESLISRLEIGAATLSRAVQRNSSCHDCPGRPDRLARRVGVWSDGSPRRPHVGTRHPLREGCVFSQSRNQISH